MRQLISRLSERPGLNRLSACPPTLLVADGTLASSPRWPCPVRIENAVFLSRIPAVSSP
jgi:hypothetical protein